MKPHEILKKIIDEHGSCGWIGESDGGICDACPMGGINSCTVFVDKVTGHTSDADYAEAAKRTLADMEVDRIILGDDVEQ